MEHIPETMSLQKFLASGKSTRQNEAVTEQLALAIRQMHSNGVVHTDFHEENKEHPGNNIIVENHSTKPKVRIIDFGRAKFVDKVADHEYFKTSISWKKGNEHGLDVKRDWVDAVYFGDVTQDTNKEYMYRFPGMNDLYMARKLVGPLLWKV